MKKNAFTFLEILLVVALIGLIALLLANIIPSSFNIYDTSLRENESFANLNIMMDKLARDIRQGKEVVYITTNTLTVRLSSNETHTYSLILGSDGKRYFAVDGTILAGPIQTIAFAGLDASMIYTTSTSQIKMIVYTITFLDGKKMSSSIGLRAEIITPMVSGIIITEILNRSTSMPPGQEKRYYFIEIYNLSTQTVNLQNWRVSINGNNYQIYSPYSLAPNQHVVIGGSNFEASNFGSPSFSSLNLSSDISFNTSTNSIRILDNYNNILDSITYTSGWGGRFIPSTYSWYSMERIYYTAPTQNQSNWTDSIRYRIRVKEGSNNYDIYCTPGLKNSVSP
ncbi:MAG: lamin tail domain-containing protein [Dictyoglomaceae bacterium]|nr:lamin tail domain-containing protein [Dictyoglomaceae bacterium]